MTNGFQLSDEDKDILKELISMGIGKAAARLSNLLNHEVLLKIPEFLIFNTEEELSQYLDSQEHQEYVNVSQTFDGGLNGVGIVSFPIERGKTLVDRLIANINSDIDVEEQEFNALEIDVIREVGNQIINAVGVNICDATGIEMHCKIPEVTFDPKMIPLSDSHKLGVVCIAHTLFSVMHLSIEGRIILIISYQNIETGFLDKQVCPHFQDTLLYRFLGIRR